MTIAPLDIILLFGSLQGIILGTLLWTSRKGNRLSNRLLAWLIGLLALASLAVSIPVVNKWESLALDLIPLINAMPFGPLIYFYTKSVLDPTFRLGKFERVQFYPVILDWVPKLIAWAYVVGLLVGIVSSQDRPAWAHVIDEYNVYSDIPRWLSLSLYLLLARRWVDQHAPPGKEHKAGRQQQNVRWLRQFLTIMLVFQAIWLVHLVPYIIPAWRGPLLDKVGWYPIYIPIAGLIYWLGLKGYLHARTDPAGGASASDSTADSADPRIRKVSTLNVPEPTVDKAIAALRVAMQDDALYLDPELTVEKVARHVQLPPKTVSFVLNQHLQKSFNTFVNEYRIEAVKSQLTNPANEHLTLMGIAFECGFNSQATFQRTFRQLVGASPTEYMNNGAKTTLKS